MKVGAMEKLDTVWKESLTIDLDENTGDAHERIIAFVHGNFLAHDVELDQIDFMGTVYSKNLISVRVPSLMELAIGRIYLDGGEAPEKQAGEESSEASLQDKFQSWQPQAEKTVDEYRYLAISPQRLNLVDDRAQGFDKMAEAFRAFDARAGLLSWHGKREFEIRMISSKTSVDRIP